MESLLSFTSDESECGYLPDQSSRMEYQVVREISPAEYMAKMLEGWRRFGFTLFRPRCLSCKACQPLRIDVNTFRPDRGQRRVRRSNQERVRLEIGQPRVDSFRLKLYDRYHAGQTERKGWPDHEPKDVYSYFESFVHNPFPTQEWCYYLNDELVGVGYVDDLPDGLSAIYFFHDPEHRHFSLGTWNILSILEKAAEMKRPHVYLGYYVERCPSMAYKARFSPNQIRAADGQWVKFK